MKRRQFYGKVGFHETSEKQALQVILKQVPLDLKNLASFTVCHPIPGNYRPLIWKLLLGIMPKYTESHDFVKKHQVHIFEDLFRILKTLKFAGPIAAHNYGNDTGRPITSLIPLQLYRIGLNGHLNDSKHPEPEHFLLMWLISEAKLFRNPETQLRMVENQRYIIIAYRINSLFDDPVDMFHVCSCIWSLLQKRKKDITSAAIESSMLLKRLNVDLHNHLSRLNLFTSSLLEDHCFSLFGEIFPDSAVEKIVDKVVAGTFQFLSYVCVATLCQLKTSIYSANSLENVRNILYQIRKEEADLIVGAALDYWHKVKAA